MRGAWPCATSKTKFVRLSSDGRRLVEAMILGDCGRIGRPGHAANLYNRVRCRPGRPRGIEGYSHFEAYESAEQERYGDDELHDTFLPVPVAMLTNRCKRNA